MRDADQTDNFPSNQETEKRMLNSDNLKKKGNVVNFFLTLSCFGLHRWFLYWGVSFTSINVKPKSTQSRGPGISVVLNLN